MKCVVTGCLNKKRRRAIGVSFHSFPKDDFMKSLWLKSLDRNDLNVTASSFVCSDHFMKDHLFKLARKTMLSAKAVPLLRISNSSSEVGLVGINIPQSNRNGSLLTVDKQASGMDFVNVANEQNSFLPTMADSTMDASSNIPKQYLASGSSGYLPDISVMDDRTNATGFETIKNVQYALMQTATDVSFETIPHITDEYLSTKRFDNLAPFEVFHNQDNGVDFVDVVNEQNSFVPTISLFATGNRAETDMQAIALTNDITVGNGEKKFNTVGINTDIDYESSALIIEKLRNRISSMERRLHRKNLQLKKLRSQKTRNEKKARNIKELLNSLKEKNLICESTQEFLENTTETHRGILEREILKCRSPNTKKEYSVHLKAFALNLHYTSPRAYQYLRTTFKNCLPHIRTISKWYQKVGCVPGFTKESFVAIKNAVEVAKQNSEILIINVVFDEIAIRQHVDWNGKKAHGFVDLGDDNISNILATQVLVFMAVCVNKPWKIAVGYFPIASMTGEQKANILSVCVKNLEDTGVKIAGITFDGAAANITMSKLLGADIRNTTSQGYVQFEGSLEKYVLHPDPCHMLKLVRNALGDLKILKDGHNNVIEWRYIESLLELQEHEGLHLANKLRRGHIHFHNQKMKVRLTVQTLSRSVADAIDFCRKELKLKQFEGSEATTNFIRIFNDTFDILNSRRVSEFEYKKRALCRNNVHVVLEFTERAINYIKLLKLPTGMPIIDSRRNVGFLGLIQALRNLWVLYDRFIDSNVLKFLPLYKINQDHLELYFSPIRTGLGCNDNPTMKQFTVTRSFYFEANYERVEFVIAFL